MCPTQCINQRILQASSLTEMSIFLLLNLVRLELRSERLNQFGPSKAVATHKPLLNRFSNNLRDSLVQEPLTMGSCLVLTDDLFSIYALEF